MSLKRQTVILVTLVLLLLPCLCFGAVAARGEKPSPLMTATIADTGEQSGDPLRERVLEAALTADDGSFTQTLRYNASLSAEETLAGLWRWDDLNFDGFPDLCLTTAIGARNFFTAFALWNQESGRFDDVMTACPWLPEEMRFSQESVQLELCCYELLPETRQIVSVVADGYRYRTEIVYGWEGERSLCEDSVATIYDAGEGRIGERLECFATGISFCWNETYPESWYYDQAGVAEERLQSIRAVTRATADPTFMQVANVSWVHLRQQDSKASPSLAKLNRGATVRVLAPSCGADGGWVRVLVDPEGGPGVAGSAKNAQLTGYIWHSFLGPCAPFVEEEGRP